MLQRFGRQSRLVWIAGVALTLAWLGIYLLTVSPTVNFIDSGELITALYEPGIAHPPGYPLYVLLGYVVSHALWGEVAWRVNAFSAFWAAMSVGVFYLLIVEMSAYIRVRPPTRATATPKSKRSRQAAAPQKSEPSVVDSRGESFAWPYILAASAGASLLGATASFWSRAVQAKMYSLHYFFVGLALLLALKCRQAYDRDDRSAARRWLVATVAVTALSFTNHMMTNLVVPGLLILLLWGPRWRARLKLILNNWVWLLPALLPLLLYLYLPLRAAQQPYMNWGSPDDWGDFWRHVTGWQFRTYLFQGFEEFENFKDHARTVGEFATSQWSFLSWPILLASLGAGYLLARARLTVFLATLAVALTTVVFSLAYPISEIEPYLVPFYAMLIVWMACAPAALRALLERTPGAQPRSSEAISTETVRQYSMGILGALAALGLLMPALQYPHQNRSNDRLAELFALNVFNELPQNSIVITNHWDFYAPTYYLQHVKGIRPDLTIIDMLPLKYPWYLEQLEKKHPWLVDNSRDIASRFRALQLRWVDGEELSRQETQQLDRSYIELLDSFVSRNYAQRPAYVLFKPDLDSRRVATGYMRQPQGLVTRLLQPPADGVAPPTEPQYDLRGITHDLVPFDDFARFNAERYVTAYATLQQLYARANQADKAERMANKAREVAEAIKGR
jgi:hypothetical protein